MLSANARIHALVSLAALIPLGCTNAPAGSEPVSQVGSPAWFEESTASLRGDVPVPSAGATFSLANLKAQVQAFDPGAVLRCDLADTEAFRSAVDAAGGVQWGYGVSVLADESQPIFRAGLPELRKYYPGIANDAAGASAVEIAKADIVGLTNEAAIYYTPGHGILLLDLTGSQPALRCGAKLPGQVEKFFFYRGHLVVMVENWTYGAEHHAFLFHFQLANTTLSFVESVDLGNVNILDSRRFNEELVIYGSLVIDSPTSTSGSGTGGGTYSPGADTRVASSRTRDHRTLRVFHIGPTLEPRMNDTLLDGRQGQDQLVGQLDPSTPIGTEVARWERYDTNMWASDHYFAVTETIDRTFLASWATQNYQVCTKSHTVPRPYRSCTTKFETRPNPDYTPPDNTGGDRSCNGATLRDCLRTVVRVSSPTIQVPVGITCVDAVYNDWICDVSEWKSYTYPTFRSESATKLFIYEYTDTGFVRLADQVQELDSTALGKVGADATVAKLTFAKTQPELLLQGHLQTLQFQNGYLYAISDGELRTFAINGGSLVQTSQIRGTSGSLQTALFTDNRLYLSDYHWGGWNSDPSSVLRVFDLSNPAFPQQASQDLSLPGGHNAIMPIDAGIFTIGSVEKFEGQYGPWLKLGLFTDPFAAEKSYLVLGTDLNGPRASVTADMTYYLDPVPSRLFLPYSGFDRKETVRTVSRVSISRVADSTIVSEGALQLPETPERVRPLPGRDNQVLTFAPNSIHWVTRGAQDWQAAAVFTFFRPLALYHPTKGDQYLELQRLGNGCKLHLAAKGTLNRRDGSQTTPEFDCLGYGVRAFANNLLFDGNKGVRFVIDTTNTQNPITVTPLQKSEIDQINAAIQTRQTCVLDPSKASDLPIDWTKTPDLSHMKCYTPEEISKLENNPTGPSPAPQP